MAPHSSTLAWKIPWRRSLEGCSPWGRWGSDTTEWLHFHFSHSWIGEGNGNPLQYSCLENPSDRGAWWAAVYGVAQSWTQLKWLSSSSSRDYRSYTGNHQWKMSLFLLFWVNTFLTGFSCVYLTSFLLWIINASYTRRTDHTPQCDHRPDFTVGYTMMCLWTGFMSHFSLHLEYWACCCCC